MTACKDAQKVSGKKAVSATLAGVLAVGMVPAMALADEAVEVQSDDGMTERVNTPAAAFSTGTVTAYSYGTQKAGLTAGTSVAGTAPTINVTADGANVLVFPTQITPAAGTAITIGTLSGTTFTPAAGYSVAYKAYNTTTQKPEGGALSAITTGGNYCMVITATSGDYAGGELVQPFSVTGKTFKLVSGALDTTVADLTFTGEAQKASFDVFDSADSTKATPLKEGTDYTVQYKQGGISNPSATSTITNVGNYVAVVTGIGAYAGASAATPIFEVEAFNLTGATVVFNDTLTSNTTWPTTAVSVVKGGVSLAPSYVTTNGGEGTLGVVGQKTVNVVPSSSAGNNVVGTCTGTFNQVQAFATFKYGDEELPSTFSSNASDASPVYFDTADIAVYNGATALTAGTEYAVTVQYTAPGETTSRTYNIAGAQNNTAGATAAGPILQAPGTYEVTVKVTPSTVAYAVGGTKVVNVTVVAGAVNADADAFITFNDGAATVPVTSVTRPYGVPTTAFGLSVKDPQDGTDLTSNFELVWKDSEGKEIDTTKLAGGTLPVGSYTLSIASDAGYTLSGTTSIPVTVTKGNLKDMAFVASGNIEAGTGDVTKLFLNTSAGTVDLTSDANTSSAAKYAVVSGDTKAYTGDLTALPSGNTVNYTWQTEVDGQWQDVTSIDQNAAGQYRLIVSPANEVTADNFEFATDEGTILYIIAAPANTDIFKDVADGDWFAGPVTEAAAAGAMKGVGQGLFAPYETFDRAQMASALYKMAGGSISNEGQVTGDETNGYVSFNDVNPREWYAEAIQWCKNTGIVSGYPNGDFGPTEPITREQFASMLGRFVEKYEGKSIAVADVDAALENIQDAGQIDGWARDVVAWAVQDGIMGNKGYTYPTATTLRCEAAAMFANYLK